MSHVNESQTYTNISGNAWQTQDPYSLDYYSAYSYDANGNILTLDRYAEDETLMDSLSYHYITGTNQLEYVDDQVTESAFDYDIDDQSGGNYTYDEIGNLISDASEYIAEIKWTVYGKIKQIIRDSTVSHGKPDLLFEYSPDRHRVAKHVTDTSGTTVSTWYNRNASGKKVMITILKKRKRNKLVLKYEK